MTLVTWKEKVARRFNAASTTYDEAATPQRHLALHLANTIQTQSLPRNPVVLEVGCGTGFLTEALAPALQPALWHATDIAPQMVWACLNRMKPYAVTLEGRCMDGEAPDLLPGTVDLVVSGMTAQWFSDHVGALHRLHDLLHPGGLLAMTLPGAGTFSEWRTLCERAGVQAALPPGPSRQDLEAQLPRAQISTLTIPVLCPDLVGFLDHLRHTGARTAPPGTDPMTTAQMRCLVQMTRGRPLTMTYEILTVLWSRP